MTVTAVYINVESNLTTNPLKDSRPGKALNSHSTRKIRLPDKVSLIQQATIPYNWLKDS